MTYDQKKWIYELIKENVPLRIIKGKYSLSESKIARINWMFKDERGKLEFSSSKLGIKIFKSRKIKGSAIEFIGNQETPFTSKDVCIHLKEILDVDIDQRTMTKFMKTNLKCHLKRHHLDRFKLISIYRIRRCPFPLCLVPCEFGRISVFEKFSAKNFM